MAEEIPLPCQEASRRDSLFVGYQHAATDDSSDAILRVYLEPANGTGGSPPAGHRLDPSAVEPQNPKAFFFRDSIFLNLDARIGSHPDEIPIGKGNFRLAPALCPVNVARIDRVARRHGEWDSTPCFQDINPPFYTSDYPDRCGEGQIMEKKQGDKKTKAKDRSVFHSNSFFKQHHPHLQYSLIVL
jgi:hypothetical protein